MNKIKKNNNPLENFMAPWKEDLRRCYIECECGAIEDMLIMEYMKDEESFVNEDGFTIYQLIAGENFWQRTKHAIRHIINGRKKWSGFSETILSYVDIQRANRFFQKYLRERDEFFSKTDK